MPGGAGAARRRGIGWVWRVCGKVDAEEIVCVCVCVTRQHRSCYQHTLSTELSDTPQVRTCSEDLALLSFQRMCHHTHKARQPTLPLSNNDLPRLFLNIFLSDGPGVLSFVFFFVSLRVFWERPAYSPTLLLLLPPV